MAKNKLFLTFTLRFSLINDQHVEVLNMLDELTEKDERSKNQIIIDALAEYFRNRTGEDISGTTFVDTETFEKRLAEEREKLRVEVYQEVIQFIAGNALSGGVKAVPIKQEEVEVQGDEVIDDYSEFGDNGVIMKDVMKWS